MQGELDACSRAGHYIYAVYRTIVNIRFAGHSFALYELLAPTSDIGFSLNDRKLDLGTLHYRDIGLECTLLTKP